MTKPSSHISINNLRQALPPSKPGKLALAVSMAVGAMPALAAFDNQVDVFVRPGSDRSYGGIEGVLPFSQTGTSLTFADLKFKLGQSGSYEGNLGVGHRFLTDNKQWALGFYGAWDHRSSVNSNAFNQITAGAEAISDNLDFRFNYYFPITDRALLNLGSNFGFQGFSIYQSGIWEEAMRGFDVEAGVLLPVSDKWETRAYAAYYNFEGKDIAPQMDGWRVRLEVRPTNNIAISLSHQQDDMFKDQTSLEMRYTFGKDGKSGIRSLKERMTNPWTRDIDIVVSTPQEGAANSDFGRVVTGLDGSVVHINSAYVGGSNDGSFERPYVSVAQCEAAGGSNGKCLMVGGSVSGALNTTVTGDYNLIRLWEGNSQGDGGYTPITLLNGQMLAGEPITARNIVFMHNDPTVVAYRATHGLPNWFVDPVDTSTAPVINGITNGGTSVQLGSDTSVLGIATTNGGIEGKYSAGKIDLMYNQVNNYYSGMGIAIANVNANSDIRIMYNNIVTGGDDAAGIVLANIADGGTAVMNAYISRNNVWVDGGSSSGTGIGLFNAAIDGTATMTTTIVNNYIGVSSNSGDGSSKYGLSDATGIAAVNTAKYYSGSTFATMNTGIVNNYINVYGSNTATGIALFNASVKAPGGDGAAVANQNTYIGRNNSDGYDGSTGIRVTGGQDAYGIAASNFAIGDASANQYNGIFDNTLSVTDLNGMDSATGVALFNAASNNGNADQNTRFAYNTINAISNNGNATGIDANNIAANKYYSGAYTGTAAAQYLSLYRDTINATSNSPFAHATGINLNNEGVAGNVGAAVTATQRLWGTYATINATGADGATGIRANNGGTYYAGGTAALNQGVYLWDANITATANGKYGDATGVALNNDGGTRITASQSFMLSQNYGVGSNITANANGNSGDSYGINAMNTATARGTATQNMGVYNSSITANANGYYSASAFGVDMFNSANSTILHGYGATVFTATATQNLNLDGVSITAFSNGDPKGVAATGVRAINDGNSRYYNSVATANQHLNFTYTDITATANNGGATGIEMRNDGSSRWDGSSTANQTLGFWRGSVSATGAGDAYGINMRGAANARDGGSVMASQTANLSGTYYDGNSLTISATSSNGAAYGFYMDNQVNADGGLGAYAKSTQTAGLYDVTVTANATNGVAYGVGLDNHVNSNGLYGSVTAIGNQTLNLRYSTVSATGKDGTTYGIYSHNSISADNGGSSAGDSMLDIRYSTITATSSLGNATGIRVQQDSNAYDGSTSTATHTLALNNVTVTANAYYTAMGLEAHNDVTADGADGSSATGTQIIGTQLNPASNVNIYATSTAGNAFGIDMHNSAVASGNDGQAATANQFAKFNNLYVSATANDGQAATGLYAHNEAGSNRYYSSAWAVQGISLTSSSINATGGTAYGIDMSNYTLNDFGTAEQTVALGGAGSSVSATSTSSKYGAGITMSNNNGGNYTTQVQTLTAMNTNITAAGGKYMDGVRAFTSGAYISANTEQVVVLADNVINVPNGKYGSAAAVSLGADSYASQTGVITAFNTLTAPTGVHLYGNSFGQTVVVTGNTFNTTAQTKNDNVGAPGNCIGQCAP